MNLSKVSIHSWIQEHKIKCESGTPLDFRDHLFLFDIYADQSPKLVCYKSAQIGFSTMAILKSFWLAKMVGMDCIYTMPSASDMKDFVGGKVNRLIVQNPVLLGYVKDKDSIEQKKVGDHIIYYRGTWTDKAAIAVSSDLNIYDEEDRSKQSVIQQYSSRLQHSKYKWEWHFSNPSVEGNGVSRYWAQSDQKHWFISCKSCDTEQFLSWSESLDRERRIFICKNCKSELSQDERRRGRWVQKYKNKEYSGYWISLLMAPWITAEEIIKYYETKSAEYFSNFVLGLPYVGEGNQVTPDIIYRNCTPDINNQERVVIGCDSGLKKHYVLGNKDGLFYAGIADDWKEIEGFLAKYKRSIAVIDALPDLTEPRRLQEMHPGRVFLCHYARDRKTQQIVRWGDNLERGTVTADRNRVIQLVVDEFTSQKIPLQGTRDDWSDYCDHWLDIMRINTQEEAREKGDKDWELKGAFRWDTKTGNDHFVHACLAGDTLVATEKGGVKIKDIKVGDYVLTRNGFERVSFSAMTNPDAEVMEVEFSTGEKITGTPTHRTWTENKGWVELQNLTTDDILVGIWNNYSTERHINSIEVKDTLTVRKVKECIGQFGSFTMDLCREGFMSIIKTIILLITGLGTWNWWTIRNIFQNMRVTKSLNYLSAKCAEMGINQKTREIINTAQLSVGQNFIGEGITILWRGDVLSVKNNLPPIHIGGVSHVLKTVRIRESARAKRKGLSSEINTADFQVRKDLKYQTDKGPVYGITVEGSHEYFANGILVSNSVYWRIGMDRFKNEGGKIFGNEIGFPKSRAVQEDNTMIVRPKFIYTQDEE